jgi:hypothetical protein
MLQLVGAVYLQPDDRFDPAVLMASNRIRKRSGTLQSCASQDQFVDDRNTGDLFSIQPRKYSGIMFPETARTDNKSIDR